MASAWWPSQARLGSSFQWRLWSSSVSPMYVLTRWFNRKQTYSPSEFRGRTMSLFHMSNVVMTLGSMLIGVLGTLSGTRQAVAIMGAAGALAMLAIHFALPRARHIR